MIKPFSTPGKSYPVESPAWFAWLNDDPQAFFAHPVRFDFLNLETGMITIHEKNWWPVLNGKSLFMSDEEWTDEVLVLYSDIHLKNQ